MFTKESDIYFKSIPNNEIQTQIKSQNYEQLGIARQSLRNLKQRGATKQPCLIPLVLQHI